MELIAKIVRNIVNAYRDLRRFWSKIRLSRKWAWTRKVRCGKGKNLRNERRRRRKNDVDLEVEDWGFFGFLVLIFFLIFSGQVEIIRLVYSAMNNGCRFSFFIFHFWFVWMVILRTKHVSKICMLDCSWRLGGSLYVKKLIEIFLQALVCNCGYVCLHVRICMPMHT